MANDKKIKKEKKHFFKDFKTELKKVTWPTGKQLVNSTVAVVTIVIITAAIVFVLDLGFEMLNKHGINKLKATINSNDNTAVEESTTSDITDETTDETADDLVEETTEDVESETTTDGQEENEENVTSNTDVEQ